MMPKPKGPITMLIGHFGDFAQCSIYNIQTILLAWLARNWALEFANIDVSGLKCLQLVWLFYTSSIYF